MSDLPFDLALALLLGLILGALPGFFLARRRKPEPPAPKKSVALRPEKQTVERVHTEYATTAAPLPGYRSDTSNEVSMLRNELEQCAIELNILRQDYDLDTYLLKQELDQTKAQLSRERASVEQERKAIEQERASLAEVRTQYQDERTPLKHERDSLAEERKLLDEECTRLAEERTALDEESARVAQAEARLEEERATLHRTREVLAQQAERLAALEASLKAREAELEGAHQQLTPLIEFTTRPKVQSIRTVATSPPPPRPTPARSFAPAEATQADDRAQPHEAEPVIEPREGNRPTYAPLPSLIDTQTLVPPHTASASQLPDSLTRIGGIDREIEQQLFGMGFSTLDDIIGMSNTDIQQIARKLDLDPKHIQAHWVSQAQLLRFEPQKK